MNNRKVALVLFILLLCLINLNSVQWKKDGPTFVTYPTINGKSGFITTPSAFCAPMGTLMLGFEQTFSTRSPIGLLAVINKITFTPHYMFEFGFSKELGILDAPGSALQPAGAPILEGDPPRTYYFDSTPFFWHYKVRLFAWEVKGFDAAVAFGQDFEYVPDNSGAPSRGYSSTTIYVVFTGVTTVIGSFNFGFGKTFYFTRQPDLLLNFFASWVYSFAKLDHRLQLVIDFSNADYRAGDDFFKVATEDRAFLNFQIRGVPVKTKRFQWTLMAAIYDIFDLDRQLNCSVGTTFNIDLY